MVLPGLREEESQGARSRLSSHRGGPARKPHVGNGAAWSQTLPGAGLAPSMQSHHLTALEYPWVWSRMEQIGNQGETDQPLRGLPRPWSSRAMSLQLALARHRWSPHRDISSSTAQDYEDLPTALLSPSKMLLGSLYLRAPHHVRSHSCFQKGLLLSTAWFHAESTTLSLTPERLDSGQKETGRKKGISGVNDGKFPKTCPFQHQVPGGRKLASAHFPLETRLRICLPRFPLDSVCCCCCCFGFLCVFLRNLLLEYMRMIELEMIQTLLHIPAKEIPAEMGVTTAARQGLGTLCRCWLAPFSFL